MLMGVRGGQIEEGEDEVMEEASQRRLPSCQDELKVFCEGRQVILDRQVKQISIIVNILR